MNNLDARAVFFVKDAERSLQHYTKALGFSLDWTHEEEGRAFVCQVSLHGFQLILNQTETWTEHRVGHGRVFIAIYDEQVDEFRSHIRRLGIKTSTIYWGAPTLVIRDPDENELFIWLPEREHANLETFAAEAKAP